MSAAARDRRCFVLVAVLVIVGSALLVVTSLLFIADAEIAASSGAVDRARTRAIARSGLDAVMSVLDDQRSEILEGRTPRLDRELVIYEAGSRRGVVRLLPVTPDDGLLAAEAGKLDLNVVDAEAIVATGLVDEATARAIVQRRSGSGRYRSVVELLQVPGIDAVALHGPLEDIDLSDQARGDPGGTGERIATRLARARRLADLFTVYGVEPALQRDGRRRINLDVEWSDELGRRLDERFGPGSAALLQGALELGSFDSERRIFESLRAFDVPPADWPDIVDALTTDSGPYHYGRLDINTAPLEALAALPGLEHEQAAQLVRTRDTIPADDRATVAWPAIAGIIEPEAYDALAGRITTRCWTWRVRLAAGEIDADAEGASLTSPLIYEAVVDLAGPTPRLAYIRDVTMLQTAAAIAAAAPVQEERPDDETDAIDAAAAAEPDGGERVEGSPPGSEQGEPAGVDPDGEAAPEAGPAARPEAGPDTELDGAATAPAVEADATADGEPGGDRRAGPPGRLGRWTTG